MASPRLQIGRRSEPGAWYVVTTVTYQRLQLFRDPRAAHIVVRELGRSDGDGLRSLAWVVMPEHVHWLFQLGATPLPREIQTFKSLSARAVNVELKRSGPVWQPGYFDHQIRSERAMRRQVCYLLDNPVRRGMVARAEDYPLLWCAWPLRDGAGVERSLLR